MIARRDAAQRTGPTPEQRAAIEHPLADCSVTAGAGSGKTTVLTGRFLRLATVHGLSPRRIAAITFTEKAADEMRRRIGDAFDDRTTTHEEDARDAVDFAPISTVHAFCAGLVRLHAVEAGVDPAFAVLDEDEASLLREDAVALAKHRLHAEAPADLVLLAGLGLTAEGLWRLLERVRGAGLEPANLSWARGVRDVPAAVALVREAAAALAAEGGAGGGACTEPVARAAAAALAACDACAAEGARKDAGAVERAAEALEAVKPSRARVFDALRAAKTALGAALEELDGALLDDLGEREIAPRVVAVLERVHETYEALKRERTALDFTDLERHALRVLDRLRGAGRAVEPAPAALLVDEFQDTNPLQARILASLRAGGAPMFSVGDPKQSIFRFRGADVEGVTAERERVGPAGRRVLGATFRARPEIVAALNGLHERLFADERAGVPFEPLRAEGTFLPAGPPRDGGAAAAPAVEVVVVDAGADADAAGGKTAGREAEAAWIARWVKDLVDARVPRTKVDRGGAREGRPPFLDLGDVAILLRTRGSLKVYEDALVREGLRFHVNRGHGYWRADEVEDLVALLRVVEDPLDDHALACALAGPGVGATDADLLRWFDGTGPAWDRLVAESRAEARAADGGIAARFVAAIQRLRAVAVQGRLADAVEGTIAELGLLEVALLQPDGERRAANLRKALTVAGRLEARGRHGLDDLLRHLESVRGRAVAEPEAPLGGSGEEAIRIDTVHGAKGLEFPVVIVADAGWKANPRADAVLLEVPRSAGAGAEPAAEDRVGRFAARLSDPFEGDGRKPGGYRRLRAAETARDAEEGLRLLYVATTRAEERLLLTGCSTGRTKDGRPKGFDGWGADVLEALGVPAPADGSTDVAVGAGSVRVTLTAARAAPLAAPREAQAPPSVEDVARARALVAAADVNPRPLGGTRFVVTVSELLAFSRGPAAWYASRLAADDDLCAAPPPRAREEADDPPLRAEEDPDAGRREERRATWDESSTEGPPAEGPAAAGPLGGGIADRAALGRAVHATIERLSGDGEPSDDLVQRAVEEEFDGRAPAGAAAAVRVMTERFLGSPTGRRFARALAGGEDVRREVAFHARVRFPSGRGMPSRSVGPFDALLVKGSIDLWLPGEPGSGEESGGVVIVDHKTNPPTAALPTPAALGEHYAVQLRLYALAAERLTGRDVAGARLLLLDPGWGDAAVEVPIDVSGPALEETRRLCEAFAVAERDDRWPASWRSLLGMPPETPPQTTTPGTLLAREGRPA